MSNPALTLWSWFGSTHGLPRTHAIAPRLAALAPETLDDPVRQRVGRCAPCFRPASRSRSDSHARYASPSPLASICSQSPERGLYMLAGRAISETALPNTARRSSRDHGCPRRPSPSSSLARAPGLDPPTNAAEASATSLPTTRNGAMRSPWRSPAFAKWKFASSRNPTHSVALSLS